MQNKLPRILKCLILTAVQWQKTPSMLSNRHDNATSEPEEMKYTQTKIIMCTKHYPKEQNATKYRRQHQSEKWHSGHNDHSSIDHTIAGITSDLVISPEQCRSLAKWKIMYLGDQFLEVEYDTKNPIVKKTVLRVIIVDTIATHVVGLPVIPSSLICNGRHQKSECRRWKFYPILLKYCHVHWKSWVARKSHWILTPTYGTIRTTVSYQSSERKMLNCWHKEQNSLSSAHPIQQRNLCSKLRITLKNIVESRQIFTQLSTIH